MRAFAIACLLLAACAGEDPPVGHVGDGSVSCERLVTTASSGPGPALDVVIVVSDAASMAPYHDRVIATLGELAEGLDVPPYDLEPGKLLHLAVVGDDTGGFTAAPAIAGCTPPDDDYVIQLAQPWFTCPGDDGCAARNFDGALAEVVPCIAAVEATGDAQVPLLARLDRALGADNPAAVAFVRPDAFLFVVVITTEDDASPGDVDAYADRLLAGRDPRRTAIGIVGPAAAPRLAALATRFDRAFLDEPDDAEWGDVARMHEYFRGDLVLHGCIEAGAISGPEPECYSESGIPPCEMAAPDRPSATTPLPCVWVREATPSEAASLCEYRAIVERPLWEHDGDVLRCACDL